MKIFNKFFRKKTMELQRQSIFELLWIPISVLEEHDEIIIEKTIECIETDDLPVVRYLIRIKGTEKVLKEILVNEYGSGLIYSQEAIEVRKNYDELMNLIAKYMEAYIKNNAADGIKVSSVVGSTFEDACHS